MKFPTDLVVGEACSEHVLARECYIQELRHKVMEFKMIGEARESLRPPSPPTLAKWDDEVRDEQVLQQVEPNESLELVSRDQQRLELTVRLRTKMAPELRQALKRLLIEH